MPRSPDPPCGARAARASSSARRRRRRLVEVRLDVLGRRRSRRAQHVFEHPLAALHGRRAVRRRRHRQDAAVAEQPAAFASRELDAAKAAAADVRDAVVPREALVDERVVGGEQIDDARVLAQHAREQQLGLACGTPARRLPSNSLLVGLTVSSWRRPSHCDAKFATSASAFGSASMRRTSRSSTAGSRKLAGRGRRAARARRRDAAPQEERQARRELDVADAIDGPGGRSAGSASKRKMNSGSTSTRATAR